MATKLRPVAIVPVKAVLSTLTALSQGSLPVACAYTGSAARNIRAGIPHLRECLRIQMKRGRLMERMLCIDSFRLRFPAMLPSGRTSWSECRAGPNGRPMLSRGVGMQIRHTLNFALEGLRKHRERRAGWQWKSCQTIPFRDDQEEHRTAARVKARRNAMSEYSSPLRAPQCGQNI